MSITDAIQNRTAANQNGDQSSSPTLMAIHVDPQIIVQIRIAKSGQRCLDMRTRLQINFHFQIRLNIFTENKFLLTENF